MSLNRREWLATGALAGMVAAVTPVMAQQAAPAAAPAAPATAPKAPAPALNPAIAAEPPLPPLQGQVTEEQLGQMLESLGLKPEKKAQRYDFAFTAPLEDQQWELSMSAILSHDQQSVWIMAWLDPLPKSSNDVPRTALLRLLAENDRLGQGKFFAYIPANRRFVLQRVVVNENLTSAKLRFFLQDLGSSVIETHAVWSVESWNQSTTPPSPDGTTATEGVAPPAAATATPAAGTAPAARSADNQPKFEQPVRR